MTPTMEIARLLRTHISDPNTQWSLGTFGGIAEFSRDLDEPVELAAPGKIFSAVTARGGIAIELRDHLRPFASESITKQSWSHRVALCLPENECAMNRRSVLTELTEDVDAMREQDRNGILFDLGLDARQADLCVRIADPEIISRLRPYLLRSLFEPNNPAMGIILATNPHRVFVSRIGRIEVYQPIPDARGKSPEGPHTHVLPKLLKARRTHPATEPIPDGWVPCAHLYPAHPAKNAMGEAQSFDAARHDAFQQLLEMFGHAEALATKKRVLAAVANEEHPESLHPAQDRLARTNIRIAIRQLSAATHPARTLSAWISMLDHFDGVSVEENDDEALQHDH